MSSLITSVFVLPTLSQYCSSSASSKSSILKSNRFFIALYRIYVYNGIMKARYQYRFYPTDQQQQGLAQLFGCVRVVWNDALAFCKQSVKFPGFNKLSALLTQTKKTVEREWLKDVSSVPLQQSLRQLEVAYKNFFNSRNGKRKGKKLGSPNFKKRTNSQSATFANTAFSLSGESVYLAKIGDLNPIWLESCRLILVQSR